MGWFTVLKNIILAIGVPTIVIALIYIGRKLQILDGLKTTTETIKHNLKVVSDFMITNLNFSPTELQSYSPLELTEKGKGVINELGFKGVFDTNKADFFAYIDEQKPGLKYDVEAAAIKSIYFLADKPYMNFLKIFFYNHPDRNMGNTAPTLGVYVRDIYLAEHTEIKE